MDRFTRLFTRIIANKLKSRLQIANIPIDRLLDLGTNKVAVFNVLQLNDREKPDYKISEYVEVVRNVNLLLNQSGLDSIG